MFILGIETSCDETAASVLTDDYRLLSNVVLSQDEIHAPYGGIVPELASRRHITSIGYVVDESLRRAGLRSEKIDIFAVTQGPGLVGSLLVGISFAKGLAYYHNKSLIPIDHLESHISSIRLEHKMVSYPALALLVSGGHTSLYLQKDQLDFQLIAKTRDDAAGEALDKIAKFLGLGYPGGPVIDKLAEKGNPKAFSFSLPHMRDRSLDFSFSGFKTAALQLIKKHNIQKEHPQFLDFLASFENSIIHSLISNMESAAKLHSPRSLILCGGVARNRKLRRAFESFARKSKLPAYVPSPEYCTDNAAMVAASALNKLQNTKKPELALDLNAYPRMLL